MGNSRKTTRWTDDKKMYLLSCVLSGPEHLGESNGINSASVASILQQKFQCVFSKNGVERQLWRFSRSLGPGISSKDFWSKVQERGIDAVSARLTDTQLELLQEYLRELPNVESHDRNEPGVHEDRRGSRGSVNSHTATRSIDHPSIINNGLQHGSNSTRTNQSPTLPINHNLDDHRDVDNVVKCIRSVLHAGITAPGLQEQLQKANERNGQLEQRLANQEAQLPSGVNQQALTPSRGRRSTERLSHASNNPENRYDDLMRYIWIPRDESAFPAGLDHTTLCGYWNDCRTLLALVTEDKVRGPRTIQAGQIPTTFPAFLFKLFQGTGDCSLCELGASVGDMDRSTYRNVLQAYIMDILCENIFLTNEWHKSIAGESKTGMLLHYRKLQAARHGGLEALRQLDTLAFKSALIEAGVHSEKGLVSEKADMLATQTCRLLEPFFADDAGCEFLRGRRHERIEKCAQDLIKLKFDLLIASRRYVIQWASANAQFDERTMISEPRQDTAAGLKVKLCVFPGLVECDFVKVERSSEDFELVLLCNRSFFSREDERLQGEIVVAKSVVLVQ